MRAAVWTVRAAHAARARLAEGGLDALALPRPPELPRGTGRTVERAIRIASRNCLVRAAVRQAWHAARGRERAIVIGVTAPSRGFRAHAWLEGDPPSASRGFREIARRPAS